MSKPRSSSQQELLCNMLSPEAKEFVPRQQSGVSDTDVLGVEGGGLLPTPGGERLSQQPLNGLPSYITTCYPFVPTGDQRFGTGRPRLRGKYPQVFPPPQFQPLQQGFMRNRFPHPAKNFMASGPWAPAVGDGYQPYTSLPNGMPFDGGTYQNGLVSPLGSHLQALSNHDNKMMTSPRGAKSYGGTEKGEEGCGDVTNGLPNAQEQTWKNSKVRPAPRSPKSRENKGEITKVCLKNFGIQTDFPMLLANSTLEEIPNSLYNKHRHPGHKTRHKNRIHHRKNSGHTSDSDDDSDNAFNSGALHRKNQVSNGTNPAGDFATDDGNHSKNIASRNFDNKYSIKKGPHIGASSMQDISKKVPSTGVKTNHLTYADIIQGHSSVTNRVAMDTKSDLEQNCDMGSSKKVLKTNANPSFGDVNLNVVKIMEDLEKADKLNAVKSDEVKKTDRKPTYANIIHSQNMQSTSVSSSKGVTRTNPEVTSVSSDSAIVTPDQKSLAQPGSYPGPRLVIPGSTGQEEGQMRINSISQGQTEGQSGVKYLGHGSEGQSSHSGPQDQSHGPNDQGEATDGKKKRRRRRRRKKKSGDAIGGESCDDAQSGGNEEVTLHFEDEEEFPDLSGMAGGDNQNSSLGVSRLSYSDMLKSKATVQSVRPPAETTSGPVVNEISDTGVGGAAVKESRNSRKRRKRREVANKAADAEMAEINLEQHMLELKIKQKHPLTSRKSASPVRSTPGVAATATAQAIRKLPPTSPTPSSGSGKKVSLLLPGTVAPDVAPLSNPLSQPSNTTGKQHGILKTSQPLSQPTSGGKKSKQPINFDLSAMIDAIESKKEVPMAPAKKEVKPVVIKKEDLKPHNILDSSAPMKRGKEREMPKMKKPSPLKKVILKEREEKKRLRMLDEDDVSSGAPVGIGVVSGESDLSQDASSAKEVGLGTPASAELSPISQQSPSCMSPISPGMSPLSSGLNSPITGTLQQTVKLKIHSRRFREYCNQVLDKEIDNCVTSLLTDLVRFQDKQYHKDPIRAKAKRRFVLGLREVTKHLKLKKIKCVIISPNLEKIQSKGGLDDALNTILDLCNEQLVPFIFALGRRALGRACAKLVPVSVVGIFNYEGSEENFRNLVSLTEKARDDYREMISQIERELAEHPVRVRAPGEPTIFSHYGHSRTPSGCSVISFTSSILSEPISENYPYSEPETDNRGYEIEEKSNENLDVTNMGSHENELNGKDPYEADDEGHNGRMKAKKGCKYRTSKQNCDTKDDGVIDREKSEKGTKAIDRTGGNIETGNGEDNPGESDDDLESDDSEEDNELEEDDNDGDISSDEGDEIGRFGVDNTPGTKTKGESLAAVGEKELVFDTGDEDDLTDSDAEDHLIEVDDTIQDLPKFIDSVHSFDLNEILSQHSSKTMENGEDVMSTHSSKTTHSSRTLGDGSSLPTDKQCKIVEKKNPESISLKGKNCIDKENRTLSWVKEAQSLHFTDQVDDDNDGDETAVDVNNVALGCLDAVA